MKRGFLSYILAHVGLILLGIATIFSVVALCGPHWTDGRVTASGGKETYVFLGLWQTCASMEYEYFFYTTMRGWAYCIDSHGWDTRAGQLELFNPFNRDAVIAAAVMTLLAFLCLVIAVLVGVPYMFFWFRGFSRWLLIAVAALTLLGFIFHVIGLCVWGGLAWLEVRALWQRSPHNLDVSGTHFFWGWAFVLAVCAAILAFFAFILLLVAVIFHRPEEVFIFSRKTVYSTTEKRTVLVDGQVREGSVHESRASSKMDNYKHESRASSKLGTYNRHESRPSSKMDNYRHESRASSKMDNYRY